jgi:hypothetical protein
VNSLNPPAVAGQHHAPDFNAKWTAPRMVAPRPGSEQPAVASTPRPVPHNPPAAPTLVVVPPPAPREVDDAPMVRRVVDAASAPRVAITAPTSPFGWNAGASIAGAPDPGDDEDNATPPPPAPSPTPAPIAPPTAPSAPPEPAIPKRTTKTTHAATPLLQVCAALLAGDLTQPELAAAVTLERAQLHQATFYAKKNGRIVWLEKTSKFHLTKEGRAWATGEASIKDQLRTSIARNEAAGKPRKVKAAPAPAPAPAEEAAIHVGAADVTARGIETRAVALPAPTPIVPEASFRCAVFSDGGFHLAKSGQQIDLSPQECRQMLNYLERLAESASA